MAEAQVEPAFWTIGKISVAIVGAALLFPTAKRALRNKRAKLRHASRRAAKKR